MKKNPWFLSLLVPVACVSACASPVPEEAEGQSGSDLKSAVSCTETAVTGYAAGKPYAMSVITVGGKPTAKATAHAFLKLQAAADKAGVSLTITSAFRSMAEQQHLYNCYLTKKCNNGNLAAKPGLSPHQNGRALDLNASNFTWLINNASKYGFEKTVPSERWHYEYSSADPGGPCSGGASPSTSTSQPPASDPSTTDPTSDPSSETDPSDDDASDVPLPPPRPTDLGTGCYSPTMGRTMDEGACVQSSSDDVMYQCHQSLWYRNVNNGVGPFGTCTSTDSQP